MIQWKLWVVAGGATLSFVPNTLPFSKFSFLHIEHQEQILLLVCGSSNSSSSKGDFYWKGLTRLHQNKRRRRKRKRIENLNGKKKKVSNKNLRSEG